MDDIQRIANDVKQILKYFQTMGLKEIPWSNHSSKILKQNIESKQKPKDSSNKEKLKNLQIQTENCKLCPLCKERQHIVFGEGKPDASLMFIGEGPGRDEDIQGLPFVGKAGQLLTKIINAMKLERRDVYIANIVKSRPPENRNPEPDEINACLPFLQKQIEIIQPKAIICLGKIAAHTILNTADPISRLRGTLREYNGIHVMPTFHPAYLLRNPEAKKEVWEDVQKIMRLLNL